MPSRAASRFIKRHAIAIGELGQPRIPRPATDRRSGGSAEPRAQQRLARNRQKLVGDRNHWQSQSPAARTGQQLVHESYTSRLLLGHKQPHCRP
jgi:hypothetical protein